MEGGTMDALAFATSSPSVGRLATPTVNRGASSSASSQSASADGFISARPVFGVLAVFAAAGLRRQASDRKRRNGLRERGSTVPRHFFFGEPEPEVDPNDPGRQAVNGEYQNGDGASVTAEQSDFGWATVCRHDASENDNFWPGGDAPGPVTQEWRELRLADSDDNNEPPPPGKGTGQSVVKVSLCGDNPPAMVPYCMTLGYTKTLCAIAMTGANVQDALPMDKLEGASKPMRALVVGLGAGSMPVWLGHTFPKGSITVDALEIDPAVVKVARDSMGFPAGSMRDASDAAAAAADALAGAGGESVRVYTVGGEVFVEELAKAAGDDYKYDMVFIDAFDKRGKVPPCLVEADDVFLQGLPKLLAPKATVVLNLLVGMTGSGSSGGPKEIDAMVTAIRDVCCSETGEVFAVRPPMNESSGNQIYGFLRVGRPADARDEPLKEDMIKSAAVVNAEFPVDSTGQAIRFDFARRVFGYQDWKKKDKNAEGDKKEGGGFFGF